MEFCHSSYLKEESPGLAGRKGKKSEALGRTEIVKNKYTHKKICREVVGIGRQELEAGNAIPLEGHKHLQKHN